MKRAFVVGSMFLFVVVGCVAVNRCVRVTGLRETQGGPQEYFLIEG